jgi:hypothetical protein
VGRGPTGWEAGRGKGAPVETRTTKKSKQTLVSQYYYDYAEIHTYVWICLKTIKIDLKHI